MKILLRGLMGCAALALLWALEGLAGPQHWGSGYPYLATLEEQAGRTQLMVYEGPLRAKNGPWLLRWIDDSTHYAAALPGGLAIGNFWPGKIGTEYLVVLAGRDGAVSIEAYKAPEVFCARPWELVSTGVVAVSEVVATAAGDPCGRGRDELIVLTRKDLVVITPPATLTSGAWRIAQHFDLPAMRGIPVGLSCGSFWKNKTDGLVIASSERGKTQITFCEVAGESLKVIVVDKALDLPSVAFGTLTAGDFMKDGYDDLVFVGARKRNKLQLRVAPARQAGTPPDLGPLGNGRAYSRQWLPGAGDTTSVAVVSGTRAGAFGHVKAAAAGRVFGYVDCELTSAVRRENTYDPRPDAEIAFTHRYPTYSLFDGAPNFGFPKKNETMGFEINLKNNGQTSLPPGIQVKVWINTPHRNADTLPGVMDKPSMVFNVDRPLPPFDPYKPQYIVLNATSRWPYALQPCGPRATWKKINLSRVGERWLVVALTCTNDTNLRNNRYEAAFHGHTYHPIFRELANLTNRIPSVAGDPCSLEYLACKTADAIQCVWERSGTAKNEDVLERLYFDSYGMGFPSDAKDEASRQAAWRAVQDKYEGWRELDIWWGDNQNWERYDWTYAAELHESGHLFHPLGDLYYMWVHPVWTGAAKMGDGAPVQLATHVWGPDLFADGQAAITVPACELMKRYIVGSRGVGLERWWTVCPPKWYVRILDRDGKPVPNAEVAAWRCQYATPAIVGKTGPDGRLDLTSDLGQPTIDNLGITHYYHGNATETHLADAIAQIFTVKIGAYQDSAILGAEDSAAMGRNTLLYHAMVDKKEWTWDLPTNFKAGAPSPGFSVQTGVKGATVEMHVSGQTGATYRLYRRWEPSYVRRVLGEYTATGAFLAITQNMAEPDGYGKNRFRAIYELTERSAKGESLPRVITVTGFINARGVTAQPDGTLLVTANCGRGNPFCILVNDCTFVEYFYHYRFGHTATKVVPSRLTPGRYFATVHVSDMDTDDSRFDIAEPLSPVRTAYDVGNEIGWFDAPAASLVPPYSITMANADVALRINPGDSIATDAEAGTAAIVIRKDGRTLYTDKSAFIPETTTFRFLALRLAGRPGTNAWLRELSAARGLGVILANGTEYIVIADAGNGRIAVWDSNTTYCTHWQKAGACPAAIAPHPLQANAFFALDRQASGASALYLFTFASNTLSVAPGYPLPLPVGDDPSGAEIGLAVAAQPDGTLLLAVTDAAKGRIVEYAQNGTALKEVAVYTKAVGTFAGDPQLTKPTDVAYSVKKGVLQLYALDGLDRLVRVR